MRQATGSLLFGEEWIQEMKYIRQDLGKIQARYGKIWQDGTRLVPGWYHTRVLVRFCLLQSVQELSAQEILDNHSQGKSHYAILRNGAALSVQRRRWGLMGLMGLMGLGGCQTVPKASL